MLPINIIVASTKEMGIGFKGNLPWRLKSELAFFSKMTKTTKDPTKRNAVIVGRKTWESIPEKNRPLKDRINIVLSTQKLDLVPKSDDLFQCSSFNEAVEAVNHPPLQSVIESVWIIGGAVLYKKVIEEGLCDKIYWTEIMVDFECDTFMPKWSSDDFVECEDASVPNDVQEENGIKYKYKVFKKIATSC